MAAHVVVIDTSFRRTTVKTTPGKYMTDVLEEACSKFNLKSSNYGLKHNNKPVDISRTFRQTGLSSGAKLELVVASRTPTVVSVALQLPASLASSVPGGRLTDKLPSDTTLWLILRKFESSEGANLNFTARGITEVAGGTSGAGRIFYEMPTLNVMGRELSTFGDLQKNLAQLGINGGSCLIRLDFRKTDQPLEEAMKEIGKYFREDAPVDQISADAPPAPEIDTVSSQIANLPDVPTDDKEDKDMTSLPTSEAGLTPYSEPAAPNAPSKRPPAEITQEILGPNQRPISVFSAPSSTTPLAALAPDNDSDFEPTIAHAKLHQSRLQSSSQNKKLLSDAENERLEQERAAKLEKASKVEIKIRFPDQSSIVSSFTSGETGENLYTFVSAVISASEQPFKLVWNEAKGPQTVPNSDKKRLIKDLGFSGKMLVNFLWGDGADEASRRLPVLKKEYQDAAREVEVSVPKAVEASEEDRTPVVGTDKGKGKEGGDGKGKGIPNWLRLGKK